MSELMICFIASHFNSLLRYQDMHVLNYNLSVKRSAAPQGISRQVRRLRLVQSNLVIYANSFQLCLNVSEVSCRIPNEDASNFCVFFSPQSIREPSCPCVPPPRPHSSNCSVMEPWARLNHRNQSIALGLGLCPLARLLDWPGQGPDTRLAPVISTITDTMESSRRRPPSVGVSVVLYIKAAGDKENSYTKKHLNLLGMGRSFQEELLFIWNSL